MQLQLCMWWMDWPRAASFYGNQTSKSSPLKQTNFPQISVFTTFTARIKVLQIMGIPHSRNMLPFSGSLSLFTDQPLCLLICTFLKFLSGSYWVGFYWSKQVDEDQNGKSKKSKGWINFQLCWVLWDRWRGGDVLEGCRWNNCQKGARQLHYAVYLATFSQITKYMSAYYKVNFWWVLAHCTINFSTFFLGSFDTLQSIFLYISANCEG